ncbi:MAG: MBL fold metallo-hydrolase [Verrucomicrobiota bacterium]
MEVKILPLGPVQTNAFLLVKNGEAILIDSPMGSYEAVTNLLKTKEIALVALWLTHGHWDHTSDAFRFQKDGVPLAGHVEDRELFENPSIMSSFIMPGIPLEPVKIDSWIDEGSSPMDWDEPVEVRHVPGHCPGNILFFFPNQGACFSGDAIFAQGIGRYDLPGGDFAVLEKSIREKIYTLPDETEIYPGHGPVTSVREEKRRNPYVRG